MEGLNIKCYAVWHPFGSDFEIWITETMRNTWIIMAVLILFAIVVRVKLSKFKDKPTGFQNVVELLVESVDGLVQGSMGKEYAYFANWFFGLFLLILLSNLCGLVGLRPPTADISTTLSYGVTTFFLIHYMGIKKGGKEYFKDYLSPFPVMLPLNIISELAIPVSLSFRLFGSLVGGFVIMELLYSLLPAALTLVWPAALNGFFDVFAGSLQAYIFIMLSMTFIRAKIPE